MRLRVDSGIGLLVSESSLVLCGLEAIARVAQRVMVRRVPHEALVSSVRGLVANALGRPQSPRVSSKWVRAEWMLEAVCFRVKEPAAVVVDRSWLSLWSTMSCAEISDTNELAASRLSTRLKWLP